MPGLFLVASGNAFTVRAVEIALKEQKETTIVARDGFEAVDLALDRAPHGVFLGLNLDGLEGLDVARSLRALDLTEHVPIIFLAENPEEAKRIHAAHIPLSECLTPPYDLVDIQARAAGALRAARHIAELREHATETSLLGIMDPLTRLYNRRYLLHRLAYEAARSVRYKVPLAVLLVDIDNLSQVNAQHGVLQGDMVLVEVGQLVHTLTRAADVVGRSDTHDFMILVPHTDEAGARVLAERVVKTISTHHFISDKLDLHITVSAGIACTPGGDLTENLALIGRAENALDRAKKGGKNRVEMG